jgi:hypothetical protein
MSKFTGIVNLIKKEASSLSFTCNLSVSIKGKDSIVTIPFFMDAYIVHNLGESEKKSIQGGTYDSSIDIYLLKPISVLSTVTTVGEYLTFGFLNTEFWCLLELKRYQIISQREIKDITAKPIYYVLKGTLYE